MSVVLNGNTYATSDFVGSDGRGYSETFPATGLQLFPESIFTDLIAELASATSIDSVSPGAAGGILVSDGSDWVRAGDATITDAGEASFTTVDIDNNLDVGGYLSSGGDDLPTDDVAFLGDSITNALGALNQYYGSPFADDWVNSGVGGDTTALGLARVGTDIDEEVVSHCNILLGINDIIPIGSIPIDTMMANLDAIVQNLTSRGIRPILSTVMPLTTDYVLFDGYEALNASIVTLNEKITAYAKREGISLTQTYEAFVLEGSSPVVGDPTYYNADGIHPNAAGLTLLADTAGEALKRDYFASAVMRQNGAFSGDVIVGGAVTSVGPCTLDSGGTGSSFGGTLSLSGDLSVANNAGLVVGHPTLVSAADASPKMGVVGTGTSDTTMVIGRWSNNSLGPAFKFFKSRGGTIGSIAAVSSGDVLGRMMAYGDDDTDENTESSAIIFGTEGSIATGQVPGVIRLQVAAAGTLADALVLDSTKAATFASIVTLDDTTDTTGVGTGALRVAGGGDFAKALLWGSGATIASSNKVRPDYAGVKFDHNVSAQTINYQNVLTLITAYDTDGPETVSDAIQSDSQLVFGDTRVYEVGFGLSSEVTGAAQGIHVEVLVISQTTIVITSFTKANPGVVETASAHGLSAGDRVKITGCTTMTEPNNQVWTVGTVPDTTHFNLQDDTATNVDTSGWGVYDASSGEIAEAFTTGAHTDRKMSNGAAGVMCSSFLYSATSGDAVELYLRNETSDNDITHESGTLTITGK